MKSNLKLWATCFQAVIAGLVWLFLAPAGLRAQSQFLTVDCTGATSWAYSSIQAAVYSATPGTFILVTGPCNESVSIYAQTNLTLGAYYGQSVTINGNISIANSSNVYLYGLNVTNHYGDGIDVNSSRSVVLDSCASNGNAGSGLFAGQSSDVVVNAVGSFSNNGDRGIVVVNNSFVNIGSWAGTTEISNNQGAGLWIGQGDFATLGNTHLANNGITPNAGLRVAIDMRGGGKAQMGSFFGSNIIENNPNGGVSLQENAEISFWSIAQFSGPNVIRNNGPFGVEAGFGSQVTLAGALITGHTGPGVDIYAHSQLYGTGQLPGLGTSQVLNNGTAGDPLSAGVRLDGNSQALLRGVNISQNSGPAILALVNSSADFAGNTFSGNTGVISCDSTSTMVSDLSITGSTPASGVSCPVAHRLGNRLLAAPTPAVPDITPWKAMHNRYQQRAAAHK